MAMHITRSVTGIVIRYETAPRPYALIRPDKMGKGKANIFVKDEVLRASGILDLVPGDRVGVDVCDLAKRGALALHVRVL
jgi:cold shock CspA family protein